MSTTIQLTDSNFILNHQEGKPLGYLSVKLGHHAVPAMSIPNSAALKRVGVPLLQSLMTEKVLTLNDAVFYVGQALKAMPVVVDMAFDVDGGGWTNRYTEPCNSTAWIPVKRDSALHLRFSEARTAMHQLGALRSPVMGGYALEATEQPNSSDPRDSVTVLVFGKRQRHDANYPWVEECDAKVYSFREFVDKPYFVGPLYCGHPNEIHDPDQIDHIVEVVRQLLEQTIK